MLSHFYCLKLWEQSALVNLIPWGKHFYLPDVSVSSRVLILQDRYLHEHGLDVGSQHFSIRSDFLQGEGVPTDGLIELDHLNFL